MTTVSEKNLKPTGSAGHHDACLWWTLGNPCNLDCVYCCATRNSPRNEPIDNESLVRTLNDTGLVFRLHFTSIGEPFLTPGFVETLRIATQKHYVSFNTNLVAKSIDEFADTVSPDRVLEITASLHIEELEIRGFTSRYIRNYRKLSDRGFPVAAQVVAHPALLPQLQHHRDYFRSQGVDFRCNHFIGEFAGKRYPESYSNEELELFGRNIAVGTRWRFQSGMPCNAGYNIAVVQPDGTVTRCYDVDRSIGHVYRGLEFDKAVSPCPSAKCSCALNFMDDSLRNAAARAARPQGASIA